MNLKMYNLYEMYKMTSSINSQVISYSFQHFRNIHDEAENNGQKSFKDKRINNAVNIAGETQKVINESIIKNIPLTLIDNGDEISGYQEITEHFNNIFLEVCVLSAVCKYNQYIAIVIFCFLKRSIDNEDNYRSICFTSQFAEVFDLFYSRLIVFLELNKCLEDCQRSFRKKKLKS